MAAGGARDGGDQLAVLVDDAQGGVAELDGDGLPGVAGADLDCDVLTVDSADLRVVLFTAAPGTPQADALHLLASLDVTPVE